MCLKVYDLCHSVIPLVTSSVSSCMCVLTSSVLMVTLLSCRTGGHTGARDRLTRRNERQHVRLGFPLHFSSAEGVKVKAPPGFVPESPALLPLPLPPSLPPLRKRKEEMKFFNYEPITVNKKNMHQSRSHQVIA